MARHRTRRQRREYTGSRARELARSGRFGDLGTMELHLRRGENCPEARRILDDEFLRQELDKLCKDARSDSMICIPNR